MKRLWILLALICSACTSAPKISSFFQEKNIITPPSEQEISVSTVSMLLPLTGKQEEIGKNMQNAALIALQKNKTSPVKLLFFDTKGTPEGAKEAYRWAEAQNSDMILGPVFSSELAALPTLGTGVLSYTSDSTLLNNRRASFAVLIADQIRQMVRYACENEQYRLAAIGPENKVGQIVMNAMDEAIKQCPGMSLTKYALYNEKEENMTPSVLKILPPMIDIKKKDLTPEEEEILATPIQERVEFDSLFVFEEGIRLSQLMAILAFYDVTPKAFPIYTLASVKSLKDSMLNNVLFTDLSTTSSTYFTRQYMQFFGQKPSRLAELAYDSVDWVAQQAENGSVHLIDLQNMDEFTGVNGLVRLNSDGTNNRAMRLVQKKGKSVIEIQPAPENFDVPEKQNDWLTMPTFQSDDLTLISPESSVESLDGSELSTPSVSPVQQHENQFPGQDKIVDAI